MTQTKVSEPLVLSLETLADVLEVSPRTVRRLHDQGKLPRPLKIGRGLRWPKTTIEDWLAVGAPDRQTYEEIRRNKTAARGI